MQERNEKKNDSNERLVVLKATPGRIVAPKKVVTFKNENDKRKKKYVRSFLRHINIYFLCFLEDLWKFRDKYSIKLTNYHSIRNISDCSISFNSFSKWRIPVCCTKVRCDLTNRTRLQNTKNMIFFRGSQSLRDF